MKNAGLLGATGPTFGSVPIIEIGEQKMNVKPVNLIL